MSVVIVNSANSAALALENAKAEDFIVPTREALLRELKLGRPELSAVKAALDAGDVDGAARAFATYFRQKKLSSPLLRDWDAIKPDPGYRNARSESLLNGFIRGGYNVYHVPETGIDWLKAPLVVLNSHRELSYLGLSFHHTRERRYLEAMLNYLDGYLKAYPIAEFVGKNARMGWIDDLTVGRPWRWGAIAEHPINWAPMIDQFRRYPEVDDVRILELMRRHYQEVSYLRTQMQYYIDREHNAGCRMILALATACELFEDFRRADEWLAFDTRMLEQFINGAFSPDGVNKELTTAYHASMAQQMTLAATALRDAPNIGNVQVRLQNMVTGIAALGRPTGTIPAFGDMRPGHFRGAVHPGVLDWIRMPWADAHFRDKPGPKPPFLNWPVPGQEQWCGYYTMRSDWGPNARYLMIDAGPWGTTHVHGDRLSFVVTAYGADFIVDPAPTTYRSNEPDAFISRQGFGFVHNTITVDGVDEFEHVRRNGKPVRSYPIEAAEPLQNTWRGGTDYQMFVASYSFAPLKPVTWERRVLFVKGAYWLVQDVLTGDAENVAVEQNLQFNLDIEVVLRDGVIEARAPNGARLVVKPLSSTLKPILSLGDRTQHTTFWLDGKPHRTDLSQATKPPIHGRGWVGRGRKLLPAPAVTYSGPVSLPQTITLLLFPLAPGQPPDALPEIRGRVDADRLTFDLPFEGGTLRVHSSPSELTVSGGRGR